MKQTNPCINFDGKAEYSWIEAYALYLVGSALCKTIQNILGYAEMDSLTQCANRWLMVCSSNASLLKQIFSKKMDRLVNCLKQWEKVVASIEQYFEWSNCNYSFKTMPKFYKNFPQNYYNRSQYFIYKQNSSIHQKSIET